MRTVGIETSADIGSVALVQDSRLIAEKVFGERLQHARDLIPSLEEVLDEGRVSPREVDLFAVSIGPGSYTGLRVGVTCAKALAYAAGKAALGVPTLDVLAHNSPPDAEHVCAMTDAKRAQIYACIYGRTAGRVERRTEFMVLNPEGLLPLLPGGCLLLGDALGAYRELFEGHSFRFAERSLWRPRASTVAFLGERAYLAGERTEVHGLVPMYLRRSEAEERWAARAGAPPT